MVVIKLVILLFIWTGLFEFQIHVFLIIIEKRTFDYKCLHYLLNTFYPVKNILVLVGNYFVYTCIYNFRFYID
jgi:hypothetical protein